MSSSIKKTYKKGFFDYFPAPKFLKMSTVGLALSDDAIRVIEFLGHSNGFELGRHGEVALEKNIIKNGSIEDSKTLVRVLKELKNRKDLKFVKASLPEEKGYVFTVRVPDLPYEEMRSAIEYKIEENVPVKVSEVIFDFNVVPKTDGKDGTIEVAVSVLPIDVVEMYVNALKEAEIEPVAFEVESQATARAVIEKTEKEAFVVMNISPQKAGLSLVEKGIVVFTSTVSFSKEQLEGKTIEGYMVEQIKKLMLFWETHKEGSIKKSEHISSVRIVGSNRDLERYAQLIEKELTLSVSLGNVWSNAFSFDSHIPDIGQNDSLRFAAAVGLALPLSHE